MKKQTEYFGKGSILNLSGILSKEKAKKIFLVTGKNSYSLCGAEKDIGNLLKNYDYLRFSDFSPNPQFNEIKNGINEAKGYNPDLIISVGGGSAIDIGKSIKLSLLEEKLREIPLVAVPTTAGSGSEATYFIVYYEGKEKQSKGKPNITLPDYVILEPKFFISSPKNVSASCGADAFAQAIESYWSINSNKASKNFAKKAVKLLINNTKNFVDNPKLDNSYLMALAANLSGKAINLTKTTACHSIAYPLTSYFNIPHGHAAALTLGEMLIYNSKVNSQDCNDKRGANYVIKTIDELTKIVGTKTPNEAREKINKFLKDVGLQTKLSELGIKENDLSLILEKSFNPERVVNNPRLLTKEALRGILRRIL